MSTDLQVFRNTTAHRRPDRVLYYAELSEDLHRRVTEHIGGADYRDHYGMFRAVDLSLRRPEGLTPPDYSAYWASQDLPEATTVNMYGVAKVPSGFYHFWGYVSPLRNARNLSEIEDYPLEDMSDWDFSYMAGEVAEAHAAGRVACGSVGHMYETAWQIRGYEQFLTDILERPAWAECLLERLAEQNRIKALAFAAAGADMIRCGDDVANQNAMMFSPKIWRKMMLPRWSELWQAAKQLNAEVKIKYHSDGNIEAIVGELAESGVDILNPLQPECLDVDAVYRRYGDRLIFDGCIGTQSTMPFGSVEQVRARIKDVIDSYGQAGGLIVSPTHVLEPDVPIANLEAMCQACRQYGADNRS